MTLDKQNTAIHAQGGVSYIMGGPPSIERTTVQTLNQITAYMGGIAVVARTRKHMEDASRKISNVTNKTEMDINQTRIKQVKEMEVKPEVELDG